MIRKVIAGKDMLHATGTVSKKLVAWLAEKGYVEPEEAREAKAEGAAAARDLPKAEELAHWLHRFAEAQPRGEDEIVRIAARRSTEG